MAVRSKPIEGCPLLIAFVLGHDQIEPLIRLLPDVQPPSPGSFARLTGRRGLFVRTVRRGTYSLTHRYSKPLFLHIKDEKMAKDAFKRDRIYPKQRSLPLRRSGVV
ncbi:MAG: hypothetical protein DHS20C11_34270 [Lysobacteraceae bacterium]|nr:MAG: hypothetical protein DHS20C11_34270 [Xanthomonadaceae bacterium]